MEMMALLFLFSQEPTAALVGSSFLADRAGPERQKFMLLTRILPKKRKCK